MSLVLDDADPSAAFYCCKISHRPNGGRLPVFGVVRLQMIGVWRMISNLFVDEAPRCRLARN